MGYRRSEETGPTGSRWRLAHRSLLAACGIPGQVFSSDRRWVYVLLHGYDPVTGWDESWLSAKQAFELLSVLERDLPSTSAYELVSDLKRRGNRKSG